MRQVAKSRPVSTSAVRLVYNSAMKAIEVKLREFLRSKGYEVLESSVSGKNQTRFFHLVLRKGSEKIYCKVNKLDEVYELHSNSSLAKYFAKAPAAFIS